MCRISLIVALLLVLSACSVERALDGDGLAAQVQEQLFPEHPGLVSAVECPSLIEPQPGDSLACGAQLGSQIIDVEVVLAGTVDDLRAEAVVDDRFVAASHLAELLALTFSAEIGLATTVDCGQPVLVVEPGAPIVCIATDPSGVQRSFDVLVADDGSVELEIR
ncbi:MAG: DUF4333 domain-containing protein [Actinomycetota bacterium]